MDDMTLFEERFEERLSAFARTGVQSVDSAAVARAAAAGHPKSAATRPARGRLLDGILRTRGRASSGPLRTGSILRPSLAAAAVVAVLISGAFLVTRPDPPATNDPSPSLPGVVAPSSMPSRVSPEPTPSAVTNPAGVWMATGSMGTPRSDHDYVRLLDGRVLVLGGANRDESDTSAELYDPATGTWSATENMLRPRGGFPATLLRNGRVLVGDGDDPNADDRARWNLGAEVYDPASGNWTATGRMISPTKGATATLLRDGTVLVTGTDGAELYDPDSGTWTATGRMPLWHEYPAAVLLADGRVLVAGGYVFDEFGYAIDGIQESVEPYDPATKTWIATAPMSDRRAPITLTLLPDGKVLATGGFIGRGGTIPELFDPATGTWTAAGESVLPAHRSATLLSNGTVLMSGSSGAALYDPDTGAWTPVAHGTPEILLLDGTFLEAGGEDCLEGVCVVTGAAELYVPRGVSPPPLPAFPSPPPIVIPSPTPVPTLFPPEAGPVPPGARPWEVTVVNKSSEPATLFVANENGQGLLARLVGSVTPNVVPPGVTLQVTFLLPAKGVKGWSIWVNPGPDLGGLVGSTEVRWRATSTSVRMGKWDGLAPRRPVPTRRRASIPPSRGRGRHESHICSRHLGRRARHHRLYDRATVGGRGCLSQRGFADPGCADLVSDTIDEPAQPGSQPRGALDPRRPARCRHLQDAAVGHELLRAPARLQPIART